MAKTKRKPYEVVCISLYPNDVERAAHIVEKLRHNGHPRANRSMVIRWALRRLELDLDVGNTINLYP